MKLFELKLRLIAPLFVLCSFVFFGSQVAQAQSSLWLGNDTGGDVFQTTTSGAVLTDLPGPLPTTGIAWDGSNLYFADPNGNFTKRTADGKTILDNFVIGPFGGEDLAWDSKRKVLWRILHTNALQKIDPVSHTLLMTYNIPQSDGTLTTLGGLGIAYDPIRDRLYVSFCKQGCDTSVVAGLVDIVDPDTGIVSGPLFRTSGFFTGGLAYDTSNDTLWVGDFTTVRNMSLSGNVLSSFTRPSPGGFVDGLEFVSTSATGEAIFISTFGGNEIVKVVDGAPSATTTVINTAPPETPEDIVVGPDAKLYICDSDQSQIRRMNQDGSVPEVVYELSMKGPTACNGGACPSGPEGPSFDTLGNLFFNTRGPEGHTGVWKIPAAQLNSIPSGTATPVNVVTAAQTGSTFGEGTTFDAQDNLLFVDRSGGKVWRFNASTSTLTAIITGLSTPLGIAVDSAGDIFVSNYGTHQVLRYNSAGTLQGPYVTFSCDCATPDSPAYLQFDASDKLYLVTNQNGFAQFGKVWRVDPVGTPPSTGTPTLLVDLNARGFASSGAALGLGLPATTFTTPQQAIAPGTTTTFKDGTILITTFQLPADVLLNGAAFMAVSFKEFAPAVYNSTFIPATGATTPNPWSGGSPVPAGTTLTPLKGAGGNGIVAEGLCFDPSHNRINCNIIAPTTLIQITSRYDTQAPQPNPGITIASDGGTDLANITEVAITDCCSITGGTKGYNTDTAIVNLPPITDTSSIMRVIGDFLSAGCIDNAGIANALTSKLSAAQDAIGRGNIQTAINILTAFKKQVQAQSGKHIEASCTLAGITFSPGTVLLNDVQTLINNLRISITADPITGFVVDSSGAGISGATVSIVSAGNTVATATSDITGFYFFPTTGVLASGSGYTAQVTALPSGFTTSTPASQPFTWLGSGIALSNFVLN